MVKSYRPCVVAVLTRDFKDFLVGERARVPGAWQFPQGGIEIGESPESAVIRELGEEVGTSDAKILKSSNHWISYDFPDDLAHPITEKFLGQNQMWFLLQLHENANPDLSLSDGEFKAIAWQTIGEIMSGIVDWKKDSYERGLKALGLEV